MSRKILDKNFLTWEVYASGGPSDKPNIVFNCLSNRMIRPRYVRAEGDEADAERVVSEASNEQLQQMLIEANEVS
jgi:hypothetical protein